MGEIRTIPPVLTRTEWNALLDHSLIKGVSYIIYSGSGLYWALNGSTGKIDYSGSNASTVISGSINALTSGRTWKDKVTVKGDIVFSTTSLDIPSYTILDLSQATISGFTATPIAITGTKTDIEIFGGRLISSGVPTSVGFISTSGEMTNFSIHDVYMSGSYWSSFPTQATPTKDDFGILISGGAKNLQIYNIQAKNIGNIVYANGGGATWTSENWDIHNIFGEEINGAVYVRSACLLTQNVQVSNILVNKWWDNLVEVAATNGGAAANAGEIRGVGVNHVFGYNGAGSAGGIALVAVDVTEPGCKLHGAVIDDFSVIANRDYAGVEGLGFHAWRSNASGNDVYDFTVKNMHGQNLNVGVECNGVFVTGNYRGIIDSVLLDNIYQYGIRTINVPGAPYLPLHYKDIYVNLNAVATGSIYNQANLQNIAGVLYSHIKTLNSATQEVIEDSASGGNTITAEYYYLDWIYSTFILNSTISRWKGRYGENSGTSTITGLSGSVAHGLYSGSTEPPKVKLTLTGSATFNPNLAGSVVTYPSGSANNWTGFWVRQTGSGTIGFNWEAEV